MLYILFGWVFFENRLVLNLNNRLLCGEASLGAGYVDFLDLSSLVDNLIETQGGILDVDLWVEHTK